MKRWGWVFGLLFSVGVDAQGFGDMLETMQQQVTTLADCISSAGRGYTVVEKGLNGIGQITGDEFGLHRDYFSSLSSVNAGVRNSPLVSDALALGERIVSLQKMGLSHNAGSAWLSADEKGYIRGVYAAMVRETRQAMDKLSVLLKDGDLAVSDGARLERIEVIVGELAACCRMEIEFGLQVDGLCWQREKEMDIVGSVDRWYGLR